MTDVDAYLRAYDEQLRTDAETPSAVAVTRMGPLRLVTFRGGRGFVTYPRPMGDDVPRVASLVGAALEHYRGDPEITRVEWKTRSHDALPRLHDELVAHGFEEQETEAVMIGPARLLDVDVTPPADVRLRQVADAADVRAMTMAEDGAFDISAAEETADALLRRLARRDGMELWVAEAGGVVVGGGRLEPVPDTEFAGIWGGFVVESRRGQGIYRALTAARARSALAIGKRLIQSDSTEYSRPILERAGLRKVSTTTPYVWSR